jgi:hypothetical protein
MSRRVDAGTTIVPGSANACNRAARFGVVFVGARKAEIHQHAVAHVFGDETVEAANRRRRTAVIGADYLAELFGIEPRRHRRRADQVGEHHRQLPALRPRAGRGVRCRGDRGGAPGVQARNRC